MAIPQGGINWATTSLADFLELSAAMTPQELLATLHDMRAATGLNFPLVAALSAGAMAGPDANGAPAVGNPVLVAGLNGTVVRSLGVGADGVLWVRPALDDLGNNKSPLVDRSGVASVGPPVSKLFHFNAVSSAGQALLTIPAPGAGLRNVILAFTITLATTTTALGASSLASISGLIGPSSASFATACPVNDMRVVNAEGPFLGLVNTANTVQSGAGVAGSVQSVDVVGYVAAFP